MMNYDADERLFDRLVRLSHHWRWIVPGAALCGLAALMVSLFLPKTYRATTYILVSESKIGPSSRELAWQQLTTINTYVPLVDNDALIEREIKKWHLDRPPYDLTVDRFRRKNYLDVNAPKGTRLLEVNVEFPDASLAAALANDLVASSVELNQQMNARDTEDTQEFLKRRLDQATERLAEAERRRLHVLESGHLEDLEKQLHILLSQKEDLSAQILQLSLGLAQNQSKSHSLQEALRQEPRTFQLNKSVVSDRFMDRLTEKQNTKSEPPLSITEESLNVTGEDVRRELINSTASAAAESAGIQTATSKLKDVNAEVERLVQRVTQLRSDTDNATNEYTMAREAVENATRDFRNASVTVSAKSEDLKQMAPALVPEQPVRPRLLLNTILGGALGFVVLAVAAAIIENFRDLRRRSLAFVLEAEHAEVERS